MSIEKIGTIVSRATGVALMVIGSSSLLRLFQPARVSPAGWMAYSPSTTSRDLMSTLNDTYELMASTAGLYLPSLGLACAGFIMILLSRPIGRWLAKGLEDKDQSGS
jgi:hypothetical protein